MISNTQVKKLDSGIISLLLNNTKLAKLCFAILFSGVIGLLAQLRFPLPTTPVPITGQVFGIMLAGILLGSKYGTLSVLFYIALGFNGVPWFTGGGSGVPLLTAGFIIGFLPAAYFVGFFVERFKIVRSPVLLMLILFASVWFIYILGAAWFWLITGQTLSFNRLMMLTVYPFIAIDAFKSSLAAIIGSLFLIKKKN